MGSTSFAMTNNCDFFFLLRVVTVLTPWRTTGTLMEENININPNVFI